MPADFGPSREILTARWEGVLVGASIAFFLAMLAALIFWAGFRAGLPTCA